MALSRHEHNSMAGQFNHLTQAIRTHALKDLKPLEDFANTNRFSRPRNAAEAFARLEINIPHFYTNYALICLVVIIYTMLVNPSLILISLIVAVMWYFGLQHEPLALPGNIALAGKQKMMVLAGTSLLLLAFFAGAKLFMVTGLCSVIVVAHAIFLQPPPDSTATGSSSGAEADQLI